MNIAIIIDNSGSICNTGNKDEIRRVIYSLGQELFDQFSLKKSEDSEFNLYVELYGFPRSGGSGIVFLREIDFEVQFDDVPSEFIKLENIICQMLIDVTDVGPPLKFASSFNGESIIISDFVNTVSPSVNKIDIDMFRKTNSFLIFIKPALIVPRLRDHGGIVDLLKNSGVDCKVRDNTEELVRCLRKNGINAELVMTGNARAVARHVVESILSPQSQ